MTLLFRTLLVLAVLVVSRNATPPPGYVKQPDNDQNPPSYRYKYEIADDKSGDGQGKTEAREGEHAQGRYYVNSKRASTDVKYIVDEWGYHPLVRYGSADDHSSASASFAFGEKAVNDLRNEKSGQSQERGKFVQLFQPYHRTQGTGDNSISSSNETFDGSRLLIPAEPTGVYQQHQPNGNELFFPNGHQSHTTPELSSSLQDNDLTSTVSEDDHLLVENAGSFGQRVHDSSVYATSTTTISPSTRGGGRHFVHGRTRQNNAKLYLPDTIPGLGAYSSTALPPLDNSVTANSIESESSGAQGQHEILRGDIPVTTPSPLLINYASQAVLSSKTAQELAATFEKSEHGFAKPIVVGEVQPSRQEAEPFQYSTTFECEDDEPITANPIRGSDTTSSHVLNPIQAGVALLNSGEAHLFGASQDGTAPPAPVNEHVEDTPQADQAQLTNSIVVQTSNYVGVNPAFGGVHDEPKAQQQQQQPQQTPITQPQSNQAVEVQKSIEIYSSSPAGHELHLSEEPAATNMDQQTQQYLTNLAEVSAKQTGTGGASRTRSETFTKVYEIADNYPRDTASDKPVYVVPPATYILEDSSVLKNSLLQEKVLHYQTDVGKSDVKQQQQRHSYRPFEKVIEKKIAIPHPFPIPIQVPVPIPIEKVIERKVPVPVHIPIPHPYPVEKPVHIPIPVEKIVEKPVHIPIEVTKYIEKPIIVHAPYGVKYGVSYQQIMKPQNRGLYNLGSPYALFGQNYVNKNSNDLGSSLNHTSQPFQGYVYEKPAIPFHEGKDSPHGTKKLSYNSYIPPSYQSASSSLFHRRHTAMQRDDYSGPVPPPLQHHLQRQFGFQSKTSYVQQSYPERQLQQGSRKSRNHEPPVRFQKGNFRQSKIEYGFKPPMVPSVQYDEETASKVES